jgi:hypothetical protein
MSKRIYLVAALFIATSVCSQEIATCRTPTGKAYYQFAGLATKENSGWVDDKISGGVFTLTKIGSSVEDAVDLLYVDTNNKPISTVQSGGIVRLLNLDSVNITVLVHYPKTVTEIYSFFREKSGRYKFSMMQNKAGVDIPFPKSSLMVGDCESIKFGARN